MDRNTRAVVQGSPCDATGEVVIVTREGIFNKCPMNALEMLTHIVMIQYTLMGVGRVTVDTCVNMSLKQPDEFLTYALQSSNDDDACSPDDTSGQGSGSTPARPRTLRWSGREVSPVLHPQCHHTTNHMNAKYNNCDKSSIHKKLHHQYKCDKSPIHTKMHHQLLLWHL